MPKARDNHYVPQWYQRGFLNNPSDKMHYLDLNPDPIALPNGEIKIPGGMRRYGTSRCFYKTDLYSTFFGPHINDEIETKLFGEIDNIGSRAVWAFISEDKAQWHRRFSDFFTYIDSQKIRTPKGLDWIKSNYPDLSQNRLMIEMQGIRNMHCTIWSEGVREIVSAKNSRVKFILSDHPVTIYNYACPPDDVRCNYPNDPAIALKASQTIFPLDKDHCLILTNYEYAKSPDLPDPVEKRTFAKYNRNSLVRTDTFMRSRFLSDEDVRRINFIIKRRARRYVGAAKWEWLYPEEGLNANWAELRNCLLPPENELWGFGGEVFAGFEDGRTYYQDTFGRTKPENTYLRKSKRERSPELYEGCGCGSGRNFKDCCFGKSEAERPSWAHLSIRERNIILFNCITGVTGLSRGKSWDDVRKELNDEQIKRIHETYAFLWPAETDFISLLPKPDGNLRAVYTGIIDPRVISTFATGLTAYFDEIIIQSPFFNSNVVNPEFSPVNHPHRYKQQTLKDIALLLALMPYIEAGYVNLIPDPCDFDHHLRRQVFSMAKERSNGLQIKDEDSVVMKRLQRDDFERTMWALPRKSQEAQIREAFPGLPDFEVKELMGHIEEKIKADPLALLQDDLYTKDGGQLMGMSLAPNFEMSLFLCQATGSLLVTDNNFRWSEIIKAQSLADGSIVTKWDGIGAMIGSLAYGFNRNPHIPFQRREKGKLQALRAALKAIFLSIRNCGGAPEPEALMKQFKAAYEAAGREVESDGNDFKARFRCLIPEAGIVDNNVQRMLLTVGSETHLKSVPMAILVEHPTE